MNPLLKKGLVGLSLAYLLAAGWYLYGHFSQPDAVVTLPLNDQCWLHEQGCSQTLADGRTLSLSLSAEQGFKPLKPIKMSLSGIEADRIQVDFKGMELDMGYIRHDLKPQASGDYQGKVLLPICSFELMTWHATVLVTQGDQVTAIPFQLKTNVND